MAARLLLTNNPVLQRPGAPCHGLLTQLVGSLNDSQDASSRGMLQGLPLVIVPSVSVAFMSACEMLVCYLRTGPAPAVVSAAQPASPTTFDLEGDAEIGISEIDERIVSQQSSEALEVLSSKFFTG